MNHSFNVEIAKKYGIEKAVLLENFSFWIAKNKANKKNMFEGKAYTYNTAEAFETLFPYMKARKIAQILREMENEGLLLSRQFGKYDRTKSYTLTDYALSLFCQSIIQKLDNETYQNTTIKDTETGGCLNTDINTNIDTDIKPYKETAKAHRSKTIEETQTNFTTFYNLYPKKTNKTDAIKKFEQLQKKGISLEVILQKLEVYKKQIRRDNTEIKYIRNPARFLNTLDDFEVQENKKRAIIKQYCKKCGEILIDGTCSKCYALHTLEGELI
jgi:hypothetical protein